MRRKIVLAITIIVCFLLQCTVFKALAIASISPNLLIVVVASFGFMRGKKEGLFVGFFRRSSSGCDVWKYHRLLCTDLICILDT
mgnify:CR=1 FL=1